MVKLYEHQQKALERTDSKTRVAFYHDRHGSR